MRKVWVFFCFLITMTQLCTAQVCGCTDSLASNYNPDATINDGSCEYESVVLESIPVGLLDSSLNGTSTLFFWNNGYWTFNDHNDNCLYRIDPADATIMETLCISGITNKDIEEISQDSLYLYFGDIGNNSGNRHDLQILRISNESVQNQIFTIDTIAFSYEDQTDFNTQPHATDFDCEAFVVTIDSIYLFTKQWVSSQTTVYSLPKTPGTHIARRLETYNVDGLVTGATYMPNYHLIVLCGYGSDNNILSALRPFLVLLYDFEDGHFFSGNKRRMNFGSTVKSQVEAIATQNGMDYYLTNEHFETTVMGVNFDFPASLKRVDLRDYLLPYLSQFGVSDNQNAIDGFNPVNDIHIYPNPASDFLIIDYPQDYIGATYKIFNLNGQIVSEGVLNCNTISLKDNNISAGEYFLLVQKKGKTITHPFIKRE